jgi:hypothetical protein
MTIKERTMEPPVEPPSDEPFVIEPSDDDDDLIDRLIETNAEFGELLARAKARPTKPFVPGSFD